MSVGAVIGLVLGAVLCVAGMWVSSKPTISRFAVVASAFLIVSGSVIMIAAALG